VQVRAYAADDWPSVREIYDLAKPDELRGLLEPSTIPPLEADPEMMALFNQSQIVVVEESDRVVGFGGNREHVITWLFVHPDHRRKGVATALVRTLLSRLGDRATLNVAHANVAARALYSRLGFSVKQEFVGQFKGHPCKVVQLQYGAEA
jgi:ribosomal protein S18 acetylase RimI-like enzyme